VVVSFTTVPSGWVVVVVLLVVELELVVTGEGGATTGAGLLLEEEQPAIRPQSTSRETNPANFRTALMQFRLPTRKSGVKSRRINRSKLKPPIASAHGNAAVPPGTPPAPSIGTAKLMVEQVFESPRRPRKLYANLPDM